MLRKAKNNQESPLCLWIFLYRSEWSEAITTSRMVKIFHWTTVSDISQDKNCGNILKSEHDTITLWIWLLGNFDLAVYERHYTISKLWVVKFELIEASMGPDRINTFSWITAYGNGTWMKFHWLGGLTHFDSMTIYENALNINQDSLGNRQHVSTSYNR
jgi:hypothetical protein